MVSVSNDRSGLTWFNYMMNLLYCPYQHSHFQFNKPVVLFSLVEQLAQIQNRLNILPIEYLIKVRVFSDVVYHCFKTPFLKSIQIKKKPTSSVKVIKKDKLNKCLLQSLKEFVLFCDRIVKWNLNCLCFTSWSLHFVTVTIIWKLSGCLCF